MPGTASSAAVGRDLRDRLIVCLTFASGAVDAVSFLALGRVFTANMTGNLVLLGVAVGQTARSEVVRSAVSLAAFAGGVFAASRLVARRGAARSGPDGVTSALGAELLAQAAFLGAWLAVAGRPGASLEVVLVALSALAMGMQSAAATALGVPGISTTYVTGTLTGLLGELARGTAQRADVVRRAMVLVALLAGAGCAALLLLGARPLAPVLPLAVTLIVVALALHSEARRGVEP